MVRATLPQFHTSEGRFRAPPQQVSATTLAESKAWVASHFTDDNSLCVPLELPPPIPDPQNPRQLPAPGSNPQTLAFLAALGSADLKQQPAAAAATQWGAGGGGGGAPLFDGGGGGAMGGSSSAVDENEIDLDDEDDGE